MQRPRTKRNFSFCAWLLAIAVPLLPLLARADADDAATAQPAEPVRYRALVSEALKEFDAQNFEESRSLFNQAHALFPNARTYRGLGFTEFELRHYPAAIEHLAAALGSQVRPLSPDLRADTERMLKRAYDFVARVRVETKPSGATVSLDGQPLALTAEKALLLQVGDHTFEVRAPGFAPNERKLTVQGGEDTTLSILLVSTQEPAEDAPSEPRRWYKSPWLWTSVGIVVAGAAAGMGYALTRDKSEPNYGGSSNTRLKGP